MSADPTPEPVAWAPAYAVHLSDGCLVGVHRSRPRALLHANRLNPSGTVVPLVRADEAAAHTARMVQQARDEERAAVVAYFEEWARRTTGPSGPIASQLARIIERGEHRPDRERMQP